jgi:type II secretory ATPase GspE/PulE/Tfp pilus assembly ATPase PilB-like protein
MNLSPSQILEILLKQNFVEQADINEAKANSNGDFVSYLIDKEIISKELLGEAIAEYFDTTYTNIKLRQPSSELILKLNERFAKTYNTILLEETDKSILAATSLVDELESIKTKLEDLFPDKKISMTYADEDLITELFSVYKTSLDKRFKKIIKKDEGVATEIFDEIVEDAIESGASDIHIEPHEDHVLIRFRVDGVLAEVGELSKEIYENLLNRIKVLSNLRLDEHFAAQDGAVRMRINDLALDLRISIAPTINGQNVVIRILSQYIKELSLADLGLSENDQELLKRSYKKTFGMILTVGPTGSGKTTTLYSIIKKIQNPELNITTIEDPVEYKIPGINQIQVNSQTNITFAKGLRSIVRQDPNVILVGEIRDNETAEIAINAALTGHLLLSTFHANDAATVVPRLLDMGAEPFLLSSTLNLIVAQRLVRKICASCRYSYDISRKELKKSLSTPEKYFKENELTLYRGKGCMVCNGTGYKGRIGLFELIYVTPEIQDAILKNPSSSEIKIIAAEQGAHTFFEDGIDKVTNGLISLEELLRVAPPAVQSDKLYGKER